MLLDIDNYFFLKITNIWIFLYCFKNSTFRKVSSILFVYMLTLFNSFLYCRNHEIFRVMIYINLRCYERKKKQKRDLKPPTSKEERQFTTHIWMYVSRLIEYLYVQGWCVCRRFRVLWIGLGFLLKAMVFTFTLEKKSFEMSIF